MKILFIPAKHKPLNIESQVRKLKLKHFSIVTTIQFLDEIKSFDKSVVQILGCNIKNIKKSNSYLYIGTGKFHPLNLAFQTKKPIYILNPISKEFSQVSKEDIEVYERKKKSSLLKYLNAKVIGILVSTKPRQNNLKKALEFQKTCKKKSYIFLCNEIKDLENFPQIECWVNTACPRIFEDDLGKPIINLRDIPAKTLKTK